MIGVPPGAVILRSDVIRKDLFGVDRLATLPREAYTPEVNERVYRAMIDRAGRSSPRDIRSSSMRPSCGKPSETSFRWKRKLECGLPSRFPDG